MNPLQALARWLDVRPSEYRTFCVSVASAFLVISFLVVARSLREAFFIAEFSVKKIPYAMMATSVLTFPTVAAFGRILVRRDPRAVFRALLLGLAIAVATSWSLVALAANPRLTRVGIVLFYLVAAVGVLLLTSGFWILTSEYFALREAKRLFGMISGGGTLGATLAALSVGPLGGIIGANGLVIGLLLLLALLFVLQQCMPELSATHWGQREPAGGALVDGLASIFARPHLRLLAGIVVVATMASALIDYQFKELASAVYTDPDPLAGFFAGFYGITGALALLLQVFVASRLLGSAGVGLTLAVLPLTLLLGSTALLLIPSLLTVTLVRGADSSLRRSLHRSVLEVLWVPVPAAVRRQTKTFVDSLVDSGAEGLAAILISVWVSGLGLPSRGLTVFVVVLCLAFLVLARAMGTQYLRTLMLRLREGQEAIADEMVQSQLGGGEMTMTVTQFDVSAALSHSGLLQSQSGTHSSGPPIRHARTEPASNMSTRERLGSGDPSVVSNALDCAIAWRSEHIPALIRLLARDPFYARAGDILAKLGRRVVPPLAALLLNESADFALRRRIPRVLARVLDAEADTTLAAGLAARRFEVRYRCGVALAQRRRTGAAATTAPIEGEVWDAIRSELSHERPIWELQRLLDNRPSGDEFVADKVYGRGELSLEHTFRMLSLVLQPEPTSTAFQGIVMEDQRLRSISLEYLEQVLPADVRDKLWPFIGDISEHQRNRQMRDMGEVVADLLKTGATLFGDPSERERLRQALQEAEDDSED